jgi:hypothetical protein
MGLTSFGAIEGGTQFLASFSSKRHNPYKTAASVTEETWRRRTMSNSERNMLSPSPTRESKRDARIKDDDDDMDENARIFPQRLMEILADDSNAESIAWLPHGKAFIIKNRNKFAEEVLPKYFRRTKFSSFTRKLNRW